MYFLLQYIDHCQRWKKRISALDFIHINLITIFQQCLRPTFLNNKHLKIKKLALFHAFFLCPLTVNNGNLFRWTRQGKDNNYIYILYIENEIFWSAVFVFLVKILTPTHSRQAPFLSPKLSQVWVRRLAKNLLSGRMQHAFSHAGPSRGPARALSLSLRGRLKELQFYKLTYVRFQPMLYMFTATRCPQGRTLKHGFSLSGFTSPIVSLFHRYAHT
jgi:hypothetical protein